MSPRKPEARLYAAGVELADVMTRYAGFKAGFESSAPVAYGDWESMDSWRCCSLRNAAGRQYGKASILRSIDSLPSLLHGLLDSAAC